jgi:hypothetical protein
VLENLVRPGDVLTNLYAELVLRPGETVTSTIQITDPENVPFTVTVTPGTPPPGIQWTLNTGNPTNKNATFVYRAVAADAGTQFDVKLQADNGLAANLMVWTIYVPTPAEQQVILAEFLANPTSNANAPHFNPLRRDPLNSNPSVEDEYIELVNLSNMDLDLAGWTMADAVQIRHKFYESFFLGSSNAVVIYGGPLNGFPPNLDVPAVPASESSAGLALNNTGSETILLRNAASNLVMRMVYSESMLSSTGSVTRFPNGNGLFLPQGWVSSLNTTPGRQYDGRSYQEPPAPVQSVPDIHISAETSQAVTLSWSAVPNRPYSVWQADRITDTFSVRVYGLRFVDASGRFTDPTAANTPQRFYWISTP